jgi:hypothetical protein
VTIGSLILGLVGLVIGAIAGLIQAVAGGLLADQVRGHIQRRITARVETTSASLPPEMRAEWAEEWRAELATVISMPLTATRFARGLRQSALQLVAEGGNASESAGEAEVPPTPVGASIELGNPRQSVRQALQQHGAPVYVRASLIASTELYKELGPLGAIFVEQEVEVPDGAVMVSSSDGSYRVRRVTRKAGQPNI